MDAAMDHKKPTFSTGHEVHICHRCGWPFPNPHPSSRHRRAHKKLCGTIEGYEIFEARSDDRQVSDDEHNSDGNERTPSPKVEKGNARELGSSDGVGGKSFKSDEDVFSDAISEFSDSGISPRLEERFDRVKGMDKIVEQEAVEVDLNGIELKKVDEASDQMEQLKIPTSSGQSCDLTGPASAPDPSESILSVADTTEPVSGEDSNVLQRNLTTSEIRGDVRIDSIGENGDKEIQQEMVEAGQDADTQREEDKLASVDLDLLEDRQVTDPTAVSFEKEDVLCDNLISEVVKHDASPQTETLENIDATTGAEGGATVVEVNEPTITAEDIAVVEETHKEISEVTDDSVSAKVVESTGSIEETTLAKESHSSMSSVKPGESTQSSPAIDSTAAEYSDVVSAYPFLDKEVEHKTNLVGGEKTLNFDSNEGKKCDIAGSENESQELKETNSGDIVGADTSYAPENEENVLLQVENGGEEGAATGSQATLDSGLQSVNSTEVPGSCEVDSDTKHLEEASHIGPSLVESGDNAVQKSILELGGDTDTIRSVGSDGLGASLDHDSIDILDKSSLTTTMEDPVLLPVSSELPHNVHVTTDAKEVESVDVSEIESEPKHNGDIIAPERTPEHPISEETAPLFTDSETLREKSANEISSSSVDVRAPESVDVTETAIETEHGANVVVSENSESPEVKMQEASPPDLECSKETSSHVDEERKSEDVTTSKSVDIAPGAEQTRDNHNSLLEKRTDVPSLNEPISFPVVVQVTEESSGAVNDVNVDSKSLQDEEKGQATKDKDDASATDLSGSCVSRSDSLEAKCGSVSDKSETHLQAPKTTTGEAFDPPSFMTLVQSDNKVDGQSSEIETVQNNQQPETDALQAGWFPSLTNVVNESEGRKKNEEMIAKVTNWNPGKQHSPLKTLLNEAKSPKANQVPADINDNGAAVTTVSSVLAEEEATNKEAEKEWDSPARYPTEIKKEKKKKSKPYWVPFVCCSSVHRDL